jgi:TonB family protein
MKEIILFTTMLFLTFSGFVACTSSSQTAETEADIAGIEMRMPAIIGGETKFYETLRYPESARNANIQGVVVLEYVVYEDGSVHEIEVRSSPSDVLTEAAITALNNVEFKPAVRDGQFVKMPMSRPVIFRLSN